MDTDRSEKKNQSAEPTPRQKRAAGRTKIFRSSEKLASEASTETSRPPTTTPPSGETTSTETNTWQRGTSTSTTQAGSGISQPPGRKFPSMETIVASVGNASKTSAKRTALEAQRKYKEIELREIEKAKELAKLDYEISRLSDDSADENEELEQRSTRSFRAPAPKPSSAPQPSMSVRYEVETESRTYQERGTSRRSEAESLTQALTNALQFLRNDQKPAPPKYLHELPNFDGEISDWIPFRTVYKDTSQYFLEVQNVARLRKALKGAARDSVQGLLYSGSHSSEIMRTLERRYGQPEILIMNEIQKIRRLPKLDENGTEISAFANRVTNCIASIKALDRAEYLFSPELVSKITGKLNTYLRYRWNEYRLRFLGEPELQVISHFLQEINEQCGPSLAMETYKKDRPHKKNDFRKKSVHTVHEVEESCTSESDSDSETAPQTVANITQTERRKKVTSPFLVVELSLTRLEGTQLRALGLLSVFGFNVTYAIRGPGAPAPSSCSAIECRLLGHCYATHDYKEFFCWCLEGYSGSDCGLGPLCPRAANTCHHGGTCRQMGPAAVSCLCAPGYTGDLCESQLATPECGVEECSVACKNGLCDCNPKDEDFATARFETKLQVVDQSNSNISEAVLTQVASYLRASNITLEDDMEILNVSETDKAGGKSVWLRIWGARREAGAVRAALSRLATAIRPKSKLRFLHTNVYFDMQPALTLDTLSVNQRPEVWEGSEFILSCVAYGSPATIFTWYKDGVKVNFNGTNREMWTRVVSEDALGRRMSVLGATARRADAGRWACAAEDATRRRCRALRLAVLRPPDIRLIPSTITVEKGDNVSITCLAGASGRVHGALGFSWAREKSLLPLAPGREVWEDLYPAGSVLKLYNVQKSGQFRCQVSSVAGTNSHGVSVWALESDGAACEAGATLGIRWLKTAPGALAAAMCPPGYTGETTRFCEPKSGQHGVKWRSPDFSNCISDSLNDIYDQFERISNGYSWRRVSEIIHEYGAVLRSLPALPGSGSAPLRHTGEILHYLRLPAGAVERTESVEPLLTIYDNLLKHPDSFLDEEKIYELQHILVETAAMSDSLDLQMQEFMVKSKPTRHDNAVQFKFHSRGSEEWLLASSGVELIGRTGNATVIAVYYHNLLTRLPSLRRSIEFRNGREVEYVLASQHVQLATSGAVDPALPHPVSLLFTHLNNYTAIASRLACGARTAGEPGAWTMRACEVRVPEPAHVACRCRGLGTYALFTVARSTLTDSEKDLKGVVKITVGVGGAMCLAAAALQLLGLAPGGRSRLPALLRAATAGTHGAAVLALLECDTRQEEACPGALGWVCAACWCAGSAALCAQPLLLQAELAGRGQHLSSVALLAGVCTLAWLTARLWGGAPLQVGAAAQAVCAGGCALLAALCTALALCAALRLKTITHKVPAERRNYLRDRRRTVRHTLALVVSTAAAQAAGVAYAQPGERRRAHVVALSAAALLNGITMVVCYVLRDEECLRAARRVLALGPAHGGPWTDSPAGDTSLSLYFKQGGEVESRGGTGLELSPQGSPPATATYWRASGPETPTRLHRRMSTPDSRADIVRCVEYRETALSPHRYDAHHVLAKRAICDLIPRPAPPVRPSQPEYMARVCLELGVHDPAAPPAPAAPDGQPSGPLLTCSVDFEPYTQKHFDTSKENCALCVKSNPDVSKIPSPPIKSCLKKRPHEFTSTVSLPSIEITADESKSRSDIEQVNKQWNKAYNSPGTDKMLNKISNDLDFLLNRKFESEKDSLDEIEIEEAPT